MCPSVPPGPPRAGSLRPLAVLLVLGGIACGPQDIPAPEAGPPVDAARPDVPVDRSMQPPEVGPDTGGTGGGADAATVCGGDQQVCCPGNQCVANGCCVNGRCVAAFTTCMVG